MLMTKGSCRFKNVFVRKVDEIGMEKVIDAFLRYSVAKEPKEDTVQSIPQQVAVLKPCNSLNE